MVSGVSSGSAWTFVKSRSLTLVLIAIFTCCIDAGATSGTTPEAQMWFDIERSDVAKDFKDYLEEFGQDGRFADLANRRLKTLESPLAKRRESMSDTMVLEEGLDQFLSLLEKVQSLKIEAVSLEEVSLETLIERYRGLLGIVVDFDFRARYAIGKENYKTMTRQQREDYLWLYSQLFISAYDVPTSGLKSDIGHRLELIPGGDYQLELDFGAKFKPKLRIRRRDHSEFGFMVIDASLEGVSFLSTQSADYRNFVKRSSVDALLEKLQKKVGKLPPIQLPLD